MKKLLLILMMAFVVGACAVGGVSTSSGTVQGVSAEAQAKELTQRMRQILVLNKEQEDKVLAINVVNQKLLEKAREGKNQGIAATTKENYHRELQGVLTPSQFEKFQKSFPDL